MAKKDNYKAQKKKWYKKLSDSGFKDIEYDEHWMKSCLPRPDATIRDPLVRETTQAYYSMASVFLNEYKFESKLDAAIWEYHTEGISIRNIVKLLKKVKVKAPKRYVWEKIKELETTMKARYLVK